MSRALRVHGPEVEFVGRMFKAAKRRVLWKFAFEGDSDDHSVVLMHTLNSGKKVLFLNGNQIFEEEKVCIDIANRLCLVGDKEKWGGGKLVLRRGWD